MLKEIEFDWINFSESSIKLTKLLGSNDEINLIVKNVSVFDYNEQNLIAIFDELFFRFLDVSKSVRELHPYKEGTNKQEFEDDLNICDIDNYCSNSRVFELEGLLIEPCSWIGNWLIECKELKVYENHCLIWEFN